MARPRRLYVNPQGKYYYIINGKKKFIKVPEGMTQKQVQTVNIQNIIQGPARRIRKKKKQAVPIYGSRILRSGDMIQTTTGGLPGFVFKPQRKILSISEIATKSDDNTTSKILDLLKEAIPTFFKKDEKLPLPVAEGDIPPPPPLPIPVEDEEEGLSEEEKRLKKMKDEELKRQEKEEKRLRKEERKRQRELEKQALKEERERLREEQAKLKEEQEKLKREGKEADKEKLKKQKELEKREKEAIAKYEADKEAEIFEDIIDLEEPKPTPKPKILPPITNLTAGPVKTFLRERYDDEYPGGFDNNKIANMRQLATLLGITNIQKKNINEIRKLVIAELNNRRSAGIDKPYKGKGGDDDDDDDDGLYNDEIETIMKKRIKNYVPVVASDKVHELLQYVDKNDDFFTAVVNTDPTGTSGRHWTCIVMDNRDDFPSAEFFDSLAENSTPPKALLDVMRKIAQKMNPEKYFKFKFNKLMRQNNKNMNCGFHVMKFIEDRYNGIPFEEASGWTDYVRRQKGSGAPDDSEYGEGELKPYEKKIKNLFKSYL